MGSVSPLIAVYQQIKADQPDSEWLFIGSHAGPEQQAVESYKIPFRAISSGRWRRFLSLQNLIDPWRVLAGFFQSLMIIIKFKPQVIFIAGSFIGVPVAYAGWLLRVPVVIHQQDVIAGLANKLMANVARRITVTFPDSLEDFNPRKTVLTGNPVRKECFSCRIDDSREFFKLSPELPTVLIVGGGTGARHINEIVEQALPELLSFCQVIHICGAGKKIAVEVDRYYQFEFLTTEMVEAICAADVVVTRAGLSALSELAIMSKPILIIPMADTHQEANAQYFAKNNAAVVLSEHSLHHEQLTAAIKDLVINSGERDHIAHNIATIMPRDGARQVADQLIAVMR